MTEDTQQSKPNTTDDLIAVLKQNIENDKNVAMQAVVGRIPLLCQSVLNIHEMQKETKKEQEKMAENIEKLVAGLEKKYVTREAFDPVKSLVYGCVSLVLMAVVTAIVAYVVHKPL